MIANDVDPDEMPHFVSFHLGLHCLLLSHCLGMLGINRLIIQYEIQDYATFIIYMYKEMKSEKTLIKYNVYLKKLYFTAVKI